MNAGALVFFFFLPCLPFFSEISSTHASAMDVVYRGEWSKSWAGKGQMGMGQN